MAVVQLRRLAGEADFFTALGTGPDAERAGALLRERHGVTVHAARRPGPQRRTFTFLDDAAERTITVLGERIVPHRADPLPWESLGAFDAIYLTGGDAGAVRAARAARVLVATPRAMGALVEAGERLDVLVGSDNDPGEVYVPGTLQPEPRVIVRTRGAQGGSWEAADDAGDLRGCRLGSVAAAGRRRRCPARRSTPTVAATRSRPRSRTGSVRACRSTTRSPSRRAAGRPSCAAAGRTARCSPSDRTRDPRPPTVSRGPDHCPYRAVLAL